MTDNRHAFCFAQLPGVRPKLFHQVRRRLFELGVGWAGLFEDAENLAEELDLTGEIRQALSEPHSGVENVFQQLDSNGITAVIAGERDYPESLIETLEDSAPPLLFARGNKELLQNPGIAFAGARKATAEGIDAARELARKLSPVAPIISGFAAGVDTAAHLGALLGGGGTVAALPCGILKFRMTHSVAGEWDEDRTCIVSEFRPEHPWSAASAMQRNRTIVALGRVVICVEPGATGGTRETARKALRLSRPLFLVRHDGDVDWKPTENFAGRGGKILETGDMESAAKRVEEAYRNYSQRKIQGELF